MKKIVFGILSLLLITPVFAESIYPNGFYNSKISVESLLQDQNITYYLYAYPTSNSYDSLYYFTNNYSLSYVSNIAKSLNQVDFGSSIDSSSINLINQLGSGFISGNFINGFPVFSFELSGGFPKLGYSSLYLQQNLSNSGNFNGVVSFGSNPVDPLNASVLGSDSFVRFFFNNNLPFTSVAPVYSDFSYNPVGVQIFGSSLYVLTDKAKIYDYSAVKSFSKNWVVSSYLDGYSYTILDSGHLELHSVLPGFSQFVTGSTFIVPNYLETTEFLMFKGDGYKYNGNHNIVGVISQDLSGNRLYGKYLCDSSSLSLTEINGVYKYNFDSACFLMDGGTFSDRVYNSSCGNVRLSDLLSHTSLGNNQSTNCLGGTYRGKDVSFYFDNNHNLVVYFYIKGYSLRQSFSFPLTSNSSVDLLKNFDNTYIPLTPEESLEQNLSQALDVICKLDRLNPLCIGGPYFQNTGTDISFSSDGSGNVTATVTLYDTEDENCPDIYYTGSDGQLRHQYFDRVCFNVVVFQSSDSSPEFGLDDFSDTGQYTQLISGAFVGILSGFNIHQCPFRSPFGVLRLGTIGGMGSFLLDKFFDVNIIGPFSCLLGGVLYSTSDSQSISNQLVHYDGQKFLNSWSDQSKQYLNYLLMALIVILFRRFRPNSNSDH